MPAIAINVFLAVLVYHKVPTEAHVESGICDPYLNCEERQWDRGDCVVLVAGDTCNQISDMCGDGLSCNDEALTCTDTNGCEGIDCGANAACTDATAPGTGYSCSCDTGYEGAATTNSPAACTQIPCTEVANADSSTLTCTDADNSQVTACAAGFNLCESGGTEACVDGTQPDASADTCVPNPTCESDTFACPDGYDVKSDPNTITCVDATCSAHDCCEEVAVTSNPITTPQQSAAPAPTAATASTACITQVAAMPLAVMAVIGATQRLF
jgi:hypothetical protein|eukprot:COSAG02_NODE_9963_length_2063_cov_2.566701_2_plen_270_part_00